MIKVKDSSGNIVKGLTRAKGGVISVNNKTELNKYRSMVKNELTISKLTNELSAMKLKMQQMEDLISKFFQEK